VMADLLSIVAVLGVLGGAALVVAGRATPLANAVGMGICLSGVGLSCGLAGAPLVGAIQATIGLGVALVAALVGLDWVGAGADDIPAVRTVRFAVRAVVACVALGGIGVVGRRLVTELESIPRAVTDPPDPTGLGVVLFGQSAVLVGTLGLILLAAILGVASLATRERP